MKLTIVFPLYHAADKVPELVACLIRQKHPQFARQSDWLEAIFIDNASPDATVETLHSQLKAQGAPSHYRVLVNPENLGLSKSLNAAFENVKTPFVATCHSDCRFGRDDYLALLLDLLERHPKAGAITGVPTLEPGKTLPLAEKVNLAANLMDLFPPETSEELIPVGFAEGRCDGFRMEVLKNAGFYDTTLKLAGEDQILASKIRAQGFDVLQAPKLTYHLSVSIQQDSLMKLAAHQRRFGRAHPYILLLNRGTQAGVIHSQAGRNRRARSLLRLQQICATLTCIWVLLAWAARLPSWSWIAPIAGIALAKVILFARHLRTVRMSIGELFIFCAMQPILDAYYTWGIFEGLWELRKNPQTREIG